MLIDRLNHKFIIGVKWIFKTELNPDGSVNKLKERLVVKCYAQKFGVNFRDTFAHVAMMETISLLLALAAQ